MNKHFFGILVNIFLLAKAGGRPRAVPGMSLPLVDKKKEQECLFVKIKWKKNVNNASKDGDWHVTAHNFRDI